MLPYPFFQCLKFDGVFSRPKKKCFFFFPSKFGGCFGCFGCPTFEAIRVRVTLWHHPMWFQSRSFFIPLGEWFLRRHKHMAVVISKSWEVYMMFFSWFLWYDIQDMRGLEYKMILIDFCDMILRHVRGLHDDFAYVRVTLY